MSTTPQTSIARWRQRLALAVTGFLCVLLLLWLALPTVLQSQSQRWLNAKTGHHLKLEQVNFNPLTLRLTLQQLELLTPQGQRLLAFDHLLLDLSARSLLQAAAVFDAIALDGLELHLADLPDGSSNWEPLLQRLRNHDQPDPGNDALPRLKIDRLDIQDAQVHIADQSHGRDFQSQIHPINIQLSDLSTLTDESGRLHLDATLESGGSLTLQAQTTTRPLRLDGELKLQGFELGSLAPYLQALSPVSASGRLDLNTHYRARLEAGNLDLELDQTDVTMSAVRLALWAEPEVAAQVERVQARRGHWHLQEQLAGLESLNLEGVALQLPGVQDAPQLGQLSIGPIGLALQTRHATVGPVKLTDARLGLRRSAQGQLDLIEGLNRLQQPHRATDTNPSPGSPAHTATTPEAPPVPWRVQIAELAVDNARLALQDESTQPHTELVLEQVALQLGPLSDDLHQAIPTRLSARIGQGGQLQAQGTITPAAPAADLNVSLTELALPQFQPYVAPLAQVVLAQGQVSTQGRLQARPDQPPNVGVTYTGKLDIRQLRVEEAQGRTPVLSWKRLHTSRLSLTPQRLEVSELLLSGLDTQIVIAPDKSTNLGRLTSPPPTAPTAIPAPGTPAVPSPQHHTGKPSSAPLGSSPPFTVDVARLRLDDGALDFADQSLVLPFGTRVQGLQGHIQGLSSRPGHLAEVELEGRVDDYGLARASGQLNPFNPTQFMELAVSFRNVDMPRLTPYSATFAGRRVDSGKLSLELQYKIQDRQLQGENQVIIDRLTLGERVESPSAQDLPLNLAIALLEDSDGRIDLGLPVSGNLDDPQFSYGAIVWKAIVNVLTKVVTAPFRALGALLGSGDKLDSVVFEPGAPTLTPPEQEKLARLATALDKRPRLGLNLRGTYSNADREALQDQQLRRHLLTAQGLTVPEENDPGPVNIDEPQVRAELERLYTQRSSEADLSALKAGFRTANPGQLPESLTSKVKSRLGGLLRPPPTLKATELQGLEGADFYTVLYGRVRQLERLPEASLDHLATQRGLGAYAQLKALGVAEQRLKLEPAETGKADTKGIPLTLTLVPVGP